MREDAAIGETELLREHGLLAQLVREVRGGSLPSHLGRGGDGV